MKATIDCEICDKLYDIDEDDISSVVCPNCGNKNIFFRYVKF